jgi:retinol dehydrogenase 14
MKSFLGYVHTPLWRRLPTLFWIPTNFIYKKFGKTPIEGAQCSIYLATSPEVANISGKYFIDKKEVPLLNFIADRENCKILWEESLKIVKL